MDAKKEIGQKLGILKYQEPLKRLEKLLSQIEYKNTKFRVWIPGSVPGYLIGIEMSVPGPHSGGSWRNMQQTIHLDHHLMHHLSYKEGFEVEIIEMIYRAISQMELEQMNSWFKVCGKQYKP
jgi:hypothetical protein